MKARMVFLNAYDSFRTETLTFKNYSFFENKSEFAHNPSHRIFPDVHKIF